MAADIFIKEAMRSPLNGVEAAETLEGGDFIAVQNGGDLAKADPVAGEVDGIIPHRQRGPQLREHVQDYEPKQYDEGDGPVPFHQLETGMELTRQALTAAEEIEMFEAVALDADGYAVPATSEDAEYDLGAKALGHAEYGDGVAVRIGL